jgi:antitoxin Phd
MSLIPVSEARKTLPAVIDAAATQAVVLQRHGRAVAVVLSPERYDELLDAEEDLEDIEAFDEAMAEGGPNIPWDQVKVDLGWV